MNESTLKTLASAMGRQIVLYDNDSRYAIYALFAEEALTGFICIEHAEMAEFRGQQALLLPHAKWMMLTFLSNQSVLPFHFAAVGNKSIKVASWAPPTGMKYAARLVDGEIMSHINLSEFKKEFDL